MLGTVEASGEPAHGSGGEDGPALVERGRGVRHPSPLHARAFLGLVVAGRELEAGLDRELRAEHGISLRAYEVLLHLAAFAPAGHLRMSDLSEQAPLSQSRVSRLVAELASNGWVTRSPAEGDSRGVTVAITESGLGKLREAQATHHRGLEERFFSRLSAQEIAQLARITARIREGSAAEADDEGT